MDPPAGFPFVSLNARTNVCPHRSQESLELDAADEAGLLDMDETRCGEGSTFSLQDGLQPRVLLLGGMSHWFKCPGVVKTWNPGCGEVIDSC